MSNDPKKHDSSDDGADPWQPDRRTVIVGGAAAFGGVALGPLLESTAAASAAPGAIPGNSVTLRLFVNGKPRSLAKDPRTSHLGDLPAAARHGQGRAESPATHALPNNVREIDVHHN
jgi:hypothetical protein